MINPMPTKRESQRRKVERRRRQSFFRTLPLLDRRQGQDRRSGPRRSEFVFYELNKRCIAEQEERIWMSAKVDAQVHARELDGKFREFVVLMETKRIPLFVEGILGESIATGKNLILQRIGKTESAELGRTTAKVDSQIVEQAVELLEKKGSGIDPGLRAALIDHLSSL